VRGEGGDGCRALPGVRPAGGEGGCLACTLWGMERALRHCENWGGGVRGWVGGVLWLGGGGGWGRAEGG